MAHRTRGRPSRRLLAVVGATAALLLSACQPLHPDREQVATRIQAIVAQHGSDPVLQERLGRLGTALGALSADPALEPAAQQIEQLLGELLTTPGGAAGDALLEDLRAAADALMADPEAQPALQRILEALHWIRTDPGQEASVDALLRALDDILRLPADHYLPKVGVFGDASAFGLLWYSGPYLADTNVERTLRRGGSRVSLTCGMLRTADTCPTAADWGTAAATGTDVAFVHTGRFETECLVLAGWPSCKALGDPTFDALLLDELEARSTALLAAGARTVVYVQTMPGPGSGGDLVVQHPERWTRLHELMAQHAATDPRIHTVDMAAWWAGRADDGEIRPGGWIPTALTPRIWAEFMAPSVYEGLWVPRWGFRPPGEPHDVPLLSDLWAQAPSWELPVPRPRVGTYGDSTALTLTLESGTYTSSTNAERLLTKVPGVSPLGCGITMSHSWCTPASNWGEVAASNATDVAFVYVGTWETRCILPSTEDWTACRTMGDPIFEDYIRRELAERSAALLDIGGVERVVYVRTNAGVLTESTGFEIYPERWQRLFELVDEHAASDPRVQVVDMIPWWQADPARDALLRPDGRHFGPEAWIAWRDFLGPTLYWDVWLPAQP